MRYSLNGTVLERCIGLQLFHKHPQFWSHKAERNRKLAVSEFHKVAANYLLFQFPGHKTPWPPALTVVCCTYHSILTVTPPNPSPAPSLGSQLLGRSYMYLWMAITFEQTIGSFNKMDMTKQRSKQTNYNVTFNLILERLSHWFLEVWQPATLCSSTCHISPVW